MNTTADRQARTLLELLSGFLRDTYPERRPPSVTLDSLLDRDLGLDSLSRAELLLRCERIFGVSLPAEALTVATARELLGLLLASRDGGPTEQIIDLSVPSPGVTAATPERAATLLDVLDWHVQAQPDRTYLTLYGNDDRVERELSYSALYQGAQRIATGLRGRGLQPRQTVAIMLPTGVDYFLSFFGTLLAGAVPVPLYPPFRPSQLEEHLHRHHRILNNAQTPILITVPEAKPLARLLQAQVDALHHVLTVEDLLATTGPEFSPPLLRAGDLALLQYTSGSTGDPKGVILSHANLLANIRAMGARVQAGPTDVFVSWLPLYHDMGLIGACLGSLYFGLTLVLMSPLSFMARPARWLWAIHRHRGTLSAAPNFAYELCLRSANEAGLKGLDLSSWRMAMNGAEPVNPDTLVRFARRFSAYGFNPAALAPVYGLAEASLGVSLHAPGRGLILDRVERRAFMQAGQALPVSPDDTDALCFVSCGQPLPEHAVRIVDAQGRELAERQEGRLEFRGPSCTQGYYRNPDATRRLFDNGWLDSGDRAYLANGELYITGRVKDLIIRGGQNIYPYELEDAVGAIAGIRRGNVAVFASRDPASGSERLVVVAETRQTSSEARAELRARIQAVAVDLLGTPPDDIVLTPPYTVLKTSSGKLRRAALREQYERHELGQGPRAAGWQIARLVLQGGVAQLQRWWRQGMDRLYGAYAWAVFFLLVPPVWTAIIALPGLHRRWVVARRAGRMLVRLLGIRLDVQGLANLPPTGPYIIIANHSSYADSLVIATLMPVDLSFVAKRELLDNFLTRLPLQRLDSVFVERFELQRSAAEAPQVTEFVRSGRSLVMFPEGTFGGMPGLLPFRMGAFMAAVQTGTPVVPVALQGTRNLLPAGSWLPRRTALSIHLGVPLRPSGNDWTAAVKLRDAARAEILRHSGEPDLAP
ncbi:MAG: AMP-binding protein [Candidatus Competibacteraceae bacterium]